MDIENLIEQLKKSADFEDYPVVASFAAIIEKKYLREAATALSTLQAENEKLKDQLYDGEGVNLVNYWMQQAKIEENGHRNCQAENEKLRVESEGMRSNWYKSVEEIKKLRAELEQVKAERDAAVEAVKNMAEYIVCAGRVDYFLCDEISQEHHLKYQPKNDGNYDNEPCYKCVADWFLQGHKWQESE